ncbi:hypothetical protein SELMODRAFT_427229 [Selaginella moellendorffii]|uniref:Uncharacterized protein n=1 Tax=Selaginella moellendorffii TaxID=88036 RepID=D8SYY6_SELML|nr:hypothetical protein SELMODRAFT_427229 [Selaginella moellendorffii]
MDLPHALHADAVPDKAKDFILERVEQLGSASPPPQHVTKNNSAILWLSPFVVFNSIPIHVSPILKKLSGLLEYLPQKQGPQRLLSPTYSLGKLHEQTTLLFIRFHIFIRHSLGQAFLGKSLQDDAPLACPEVLKAVKRDVALPRAGGPVHSSRALPTETVRIVLFRQPLMLAREIYHGTCHTRYHAPPHALPPARQMAVKLRGFLVIAVAVQGISPVWSFSYEGHEHSGPCEGVFPCIGERLLRPTLGARGGGFEVGLCFIRLVLIQQRHELVQGLPPLHVHPGLDQRQDCWKALVLGFAFSSWKLIVRRIEICREWNQCLCPVPTQLRRWRLQAALKLRKLFTPGGVRSSSRMPSYMDPQCAR